VGGPIWSALATAPRPKIAPETRAAANLRTSLLLLRPISLRVRFGPGWIQPPQSRLTFHAVGVCSGMIQFPGNAI
jgi:hypothetical protein